MPSFVRVADEGEAGMLTVETIGRVRREFHVKGKKIKAIARELRVSRNTVRRIVRGDETVHRYTRKEQPLPQLGTHVAALEEMLAANAGKPQRERLTFMRMFEEMRLSGYAGGYDAVRRYARAWERQQGIRSAEAYVPLSYAPGEAYQFDWSHEVVVLDGVTNVVKVAQVRLCHSRMLFVRAYPREAQEMVFDAHNRAFAFFRGACARGIYDNMRTVVDAVFVGKERTFNRRFLQMASHFLVEPTPCTPAAGWEKGQVENQVGTVRSRFFTPRLKFRSYEELNAYLLDRCVAFAKAQPHPEQKERSVFEVFRGRAVSADPLSGTVRRLPCDHGRRLQDLPGALRQQQILGDGQCYRPPCRCARLRRSDRHQAGWPGRGRAQPAVRTQPDRL